MDRDIFKQIMENVFGELRNRHKNFDINRYRRPLRRCLQRKILDRLHRPQDREEMKRFFSAEWWVCAGVQTPLFDDEARGDEPERRQAHDKKVHGPKMGGGKLSTPASRSLWASPALPSKIQEELSRAGVGFDGMAFLSLWCWVCLSPFECCNI